MGGEQVEIYILTGADQAVVVIVSVEHNKARWADEICNNAMLHFVTQTFLCDAYSGETWQSC